MAVRADVARRGAAGVFPVQLRRRRPGLPAGGQDLEPGADREHPPPARRRPALCGPAVDLHQAGRERGFRRQLVDQRARVGTLRHAARLVAHGARAAARDQHAARDGGGDAGRLPARLAHRPRDHDRLHRRAVDQHPGVHPGVPVCARLPARLVPGAGLGHQPRREPAALQRARDHRRRRGFARPRHTPLPQLLSRRDQPGLRAHRPRQGPERAPRDVGARAAQRGDPDRHQRPAAASGAARRRLPHRAFLRHPRDRPRGDPCRRAQRLSGDQGGHHLCRRRHDGRQPRRRSALQGDRPARAAQVNTSPGVWLLAWRRFERDRLGLACLVVVLIYAAVMVACAAGWIVRDWSEEVAVTYAPPTFLGPEAPRGASSAAAAETAPQAALEDYGIPDPLADDLAEIARELAGASTTETRAATLAFGADKWGRDVLKKAVKGTETSLFVGLVAAALAAFLGTLFGALAGYRGGWIDDFFNWLYSVFTSIPYLLLVLAVAAGGQPKGALPGLPVPGPTRWGGNFRLIPAAHRQDKVGPD